MNTMMKRAVAAATLVTAVAALTVMPSQARWRSGEAAAAGFVAGAAVDTAATSAYYGPRYYGITAGRMLAMATTVAVRTRAMANVASEPAYVGTTVYAAPELLDNHGRRAWLRILWAVPANRPEPECAFSEGAERLIGNAQERRASIKARLLDWFAAGRCHS